MRNWSKDEMSKRIARFEDLKFNYGGLPDSPLPECTRGLASVIGFKPPENESERNNSPVGADASRSAGIQISEGFNVGYVRAKPGCGPLMHNHDTNETFIPMTGAWRCSWNEGNDTLHADLGPLDCISFPPGVARRFENVTKGAPDTEHILMAIIGGDGPGADFTPKAWERVEAWRKANPGKW
jgi:mannose-6-phosphate isomerase-like protein (cupin superfamily)